ncbi:hypothetical protein [Selenomonas sp. AE3005]|uniref:O-linked N-acetylglucosamine transferase, SPINDLY family protein n=1 Tax=Selenomonas sp. AE3005 TaxID=1485543 RepID=UPI000689D494|nr:hypothetical protein [Selenomonas sp. AE3005]
MLTEAGFVRLVKQIAKADEGGKPETIKKLLMDTGRKNFPESKKWFYDDVLANIYAQLGEMSRSVQHYKQEMEHAELIPHDVRLMSYSNLLMYLHYLELGNEEMNYWHKGYNSLFADIQPYHSYVLTQPAVESAKVKIKLGYLSTDFFGHIVTNFILQLFLHHNRQRFEIFVYQAAGEKDEVTNWLKNMVDVWCDLSACSAQEAAARIHADSIDILVDLSGHTRGGRTLQIAAYHPAPIQICGIGWFDTTGLAAMDYFLTDKYCHTQENAADFTEKMLCLPESHFCYTPGEAVLSCDNIRQEHDSLVFGCFNNFAKITDSMLLSWREILEKVSEAKLYLKNVSRDKFHVDKMYQRLQMLDFPLARCIIEAGEENYLEKYLEVDIALDTYPYPGGGTTCEAIFMGCPVITQYGRRHGSRFGLSILSNIGLGELAAETRQGYVERAVSLANDRELLKLLHNNLRIMMQKSPLMDGKGYTKAIEAKYRQIWQDFSDKCRNTKHI